MDSLRIEDIKKRGTLPEHVAIIMDGNGRWAQKRGLQRIEGHKEGINSVRAVVEAAGALGIKVLTLYTFSSENWSRPIQEVSALMSLLLTTIRNEVDELNSKNVRLMVIGDINSLPMAPRIGVLNTIKKLENNTGLLLNLALSYSGRQEIVQSVKRISNDVKNGLITPDDIDEDLISTYLETHDIKDPDLLIRTSGEMRISNFLLWQLAYTELYITDILWPDYRESDFFDAIESYQKRERRFGKVSDQV
ncbi:isoprenyl transferase [candidate division KSB1 bacterium]|nr:isoprenyl transferase [candidate division KSB1 bacterium]